MGISFVLCVSWVLQFSIEWLFVKIAPCVHAAVVDTIKN